MKKSGGTIKAMVLAVAVHAVAIALLFVSFQWNRSASHTQKAPQQEIVKATVVDDAKLREEVERLKREEERKRREALARQRELEEIKRKAAEAEKRRLAEEERLAELKRKQQQEQKRLAAAKKKAADAEKKRLAEEVERKRRAAEDTARKQAAAEAEKKRLAELERRKQEEARRKEAETALQAQLQAEERARQAAAEARERASVLATWEGRIRQRVMAKWVEPSAASKGMKCDVFVRLVPGGEVIEARVVRSSGDALFDRSVESAVYQASPLPVPAEPHLFRHIQEIKFTFNPHV